VKEHLAHKGVTVVGSGVSIAFGATKSFQILSLITATGSATKVSFKGGVVILKRSSMSMNASEYIVFI